MSENYLVINGKKTELTKEQLEQLGIEAKKENPFEIQYADKAYYVNSSSYLCASSNWTEGELKAFLPCKDKQLVEERAKQERLSRLLWKFAIENDGYLSEEEKKDNRITKWQISFNLVENKYMVEHFRNFYGLAVVFRTGEVAQRAIDEVIRPFERGEIE